MRTELTPAEALEIILETTPVLASETVAVAETRDRVLAAPVVSSRDLPPADNSAMDGFAVRAADLAGAGRDTPVELPVAFDVRAGEAPPARLPSGSAARILTGAPLPTGADAVVRQEDTEREGDRVRFSVAPAQREHVRDAGEDVRSGETVLTPGMRIGPAQIGRVAFTKSGKSLRYRGRLFLSLKGRGFKANYIDSETNELFWISGCRKDGIDALYTTNVEIDEDVREEYWLEVRGKPEMTATRKFHALGKYRK